MPDRRLALSALDRLLKIGSVTESMGVYVLANMVQKLLGLVRLVLLTHLLIEAQYGLWGLAIWAVNLSAAVTTLGSHHGLTRYMSLFEARGRVGQFYRRMRWCIPGVALVIASAAMLSRGPITRLIFTSRPDVASVAYDRQVWVCAAALVNGLLLAMYQNMHAAMVGIRAYRLVSVVKMSFGVLFTVLAIIAVLFQPIALAVLAGHAIAVAVVLAGGMLMLNACVGRVAGESTVSAAVADRNLPDRPLGRVLKFGSVAMVGELCWLIVGGLSLWLVNKNYGKAEAGVFSAMLLLCQAPMFLTNAAMTVVFTHVARLWERDDRTAAVAHLQVGYKVIIMAMMTLAVAICLASPLWVTLLGERFQQGRKLVAPLVMFFQVTNHLALLIVLARLQERPIVAAILATAGGLANFALALWLMPMWGPVGAAWAAGVGLLVGGIAVAAVYLPLARVRLHPASVCLLVAPALLMLPMWVAGLVWLAVLAVAAATPLILTPQEKLAIAAALARMRKPSQTKSPS